ncbi:hypothetical protein ACJMK2_007066 [Sinanodonta woodiana]|uniref:Solute carrier family 25 member 35 n=1 Tax=Sinanodonta woodiana TaxID=1069815 RepID=A0ABD3VJK3_SINWO
MDTNKLIEFGLGGLAACGAGVFTNPLEVVKTRMQLQGELQAIGKYTVHYRNSFHAFYIIGKTDGLLALQKGLVPAIYYQFFMNGFRLGTYQGLINAGLTQDANGKVSFVRSVMAGAFAGCVGAFFGSPFYMVKTHLQARSAHSIAVGTQHDHDSMLKGFRCVYSTGGFLGLWRGVSAAILRVTVGSASQLSTFSTAKAYIVHLQVFPAESWLNAFAAAIMSGFVVTACMTPFDVVSTRMYNQKTDAYGKGHIYKNVLQCFVKTFRTEGLWGFYKGWAPSLMRLAPHTVLSLVFWDRLRDAYRRFQQHHPIEL